MGRSCWHPIAQSQHAPLQWKEVIMNTSYTTGQESSSEKRMENIKDEIIDWLRDAYAMEKGLENSLEKNSKNEELSQGVRERSAQHLEETRRHAEEVKAALKSLDAD